ncbi:Thermophilic serine proteinase [Auxenochlorella protothecoides]|uniref:Thermophilic serine proteinase n=1 Tax=Auxenochlorella protothecoides TaxID=3075 RepID=A0A087SDB6_AUXPR|nr:Thermophilic serine proteinase [Auxenochlorella protothecoides]KFM23720.1 Thermophilic serine proteinase [Auxenochlorella protothecoides]
MAAAVGVSMLPGSPGPMDELGHGSHVAGIVGAAGSNALLVSGVVWGNVDLLACRFIDGDGLGRTSAAVDCVNYCLAQGARVIQASWGGAAAPNAAMQAAMEAAEAADALIVVSAGNDDRDLDAEPQYPASYAAERANVLAVAAVGRAGALSSFSNRGAGTVALAAPGEAILSTLPGNATGRLLLESAEPTAQLRGKVGAGLLRLDRVVAAAAALAAAPTTAP